MPEEDAKAAPAESAESVESQLLPELEAFVVALLTGQPGTLAYTSGNRPVTIFGKTFTIDGSANLTVTPVA